LSSLVIRIFEFDTLCGLEENFYTKCNYEQYQRHFRPFVAYCQDLKVFPRARIFCCILRLSCSMECTTQSQFYLPTFWVSHDFTFFFFFNHGQIPIRTMFHRFYTILGGAHKNIVSGFHYTALAVIKASCFLYLP